MWARAMGSFPLPNGIGLSILCQELGCSCSSGGAWRLSERHRALVPVEVLGCREWQPGAVLASGILPASLGMGNAGAPWAMAALPAARSSRGASRPGPQVPPSSSWSRVCGVRTLCWVNHIHGEPEWERRCRSRAG